MKVYRRRDDGDGVWHLEVEDVPFLVLVKNFLRRLVGR